MGWHGGPRAGGGVTGNITDHSSMVRSLAGQVSPRRSHCGPGRPARARRWLPYLSGPVYGL
eukprot:608754-Hanusia_phi.AAC.1